MEPSPSTAILMLGAARLRVTGKTWEEVGQTLGKARDTCNHWPQTYPAQWRDCMLTAIDEVLADVENEAIMAARMDVRSKDHRERKSGYDALLRHCRELRGTRMKLEHTGRDGGPLAFLLSMPEEELDEIIKASEEADDAERPQGDSEAPPLGPLEGDDICKP